MDSKVCIITRSCRFCLRVLGKLTSQDTLSLFLQFPEMSPFPLEVGFLLELLELPKSISFCFVLLAWFLCSPRSQADFKLRDLPASISGATGIKGFPPLAALSF